MVLAPHVMSKCIKTKWTWPKNEFFFWVNWLDGTDSWDRFRANRVPKFFTARQSLDLHKDAAWWAYPLSSWPWIKSSIYDIDSDSYYIARDAYWNIERDANWQALYRYKKTWELVDWNTVKNAKEKVFWFFSRDSKKLVSAPSWWEPVKAALLDYVKYIEDQFPDIMRKWTGWWFELLKRDTKKFVEDIENGKWKQWWWNIVYNLFTSSRGNHWYFMSEILRWNTFDRIISDREVAQNLLWFDFSEISFREFSEAAAAYANTARWWNITVVDILWPKWADKIYGKEWTQLFEEDASWKMVRAEDPKARHLSKTYFMKLNLSQQIEQVKSMLWDEAPSMWKLKMWRLMAWNYTWWYVLRWINFIGKPWVYSALMTFWKWMTWFMPLLILNSWMFVTDALAAGKKLDWNWKKFFRKWWLQDGLPDNVTWYSDWIWWTIADVARRAFDKFYAVLQQWAFNITDMLTQNSYKVRQYQRFFEAQFPGLKSLADIDKELEAMKKAEKEWKIPEWSTERLLDAARWYSEYSVRLHTTNTSVAASLTRVHPADNAINQPRNDTWFVLWHFFAWWWYNKIAWAWKIVKTWLFENIYHWNIWASYLDELMWSWLSKADVHAKMVRNYLENEDLLYFMNKLYTAFFIAKYLQRLSDWWNDQNIFENFNDMISYLDMFSWEYAALWATPQWRMVKTFIDNFVWELETGIWVWYATQAWLASTTKEFFRSVCRKLYLPLIWVEFWSQMNANWDNEEKTWIQLLVKSTQDNVNWYLFYLKDKTENWDYSYYTPKWPNAYVNSILGIWDREIEFINREKILSKYANLFNSEQWLFELTADQKKKKKWFNSNHPFYNWVVYSFPWFKQRNMPQLEEVEWFANAVNSFRSTVAYQEMTNNKLPSDINNSDWEYLFNTVTRVLLNDKDAINDKTFKWTYSFYNKEWELLFNKRYQAQEEFIHYLMINWLSEEKAKELQNQIANVDKWYKEEAIRTLAYMEAKTPWSSLHALAYLMWREQYNYVFKSWIKYDENDPASIALRDKRYEEWKIIAAQKYAEFIPEIDRYNTWTQFILHYAKVHNTALADYISDPWENNSKAMKLITPWSEVETIINEDWEEEEVVTYQNKILTQNFQAQLMVDIAWAMWNPDAWRLMNWYATIFDTKKYENKDWTLNPEAAANMLKQVEKVYDHVWQLPMDNKKKRVIKQWTLMFWDKLITAIVKDWKLMERQDVKESVQDWTAYWYKEFEELDKIAMEDIEDQLANKEWKSYWAKKDYLKWWASKKFPWFTNWYNYMKNRAYSDTYKSYRVFDWTPIGWQPNYLSEWEFENAKRAQAQAWYWKRSTSDQKKKSSWGKTQDDTIGVSSRRWKALQFYKREDPDKPVEYRLPWRKRWVRRWSWVQPISTTTWKHLTPTIKR